MGANVLKRVVVGALDAEEESQVEPIRADESECCEEQSAHDREQREPSDRDE